MDLRKLKKLIDLVQESGIAELEITEGEEKVKIVKGGVVSVSPGPVPAPSAPAAAAPRPAAPAAPMAAALPAAPASMGTETPGAPVHEGHVVKSPMVGTFYRSASPGAKAFVEVGDTVAQGDALCIIEAMKLMNEIESEADGKLLEVLVENGEHVEYGQHLFRLAKA